MKEKKITSKPMMVANLLQILAITGNVLYILWVTYNGIDEGFQGTIVQIVSYIGLIMLLMLNIALLIYFRKREG